MKTAALARLRVIANDPSLSAGRLNVKAIKFLEAQAQKYSAHTENQGSIPAGPDSTKFRATQYGMIEFEKNLKVPGGTYEPNRFFQCFMKIGSKVDRAVAKKMQAEFEKWFAKITGVAGNASAPFATSDNWTVYWSTVSGSAWGGYGIHFKRKK